MTLLVGTGDSRVTRVRGHLRVVPAGPTACTSHRPQASQTGSSDATR